MWRIMVEALVPAFFNLVIARRGAPQLQPARSAPPWRQAVDDPGRIVRDQQAAVRGDHDADGPPPGAARACRPPSGHDVPRRPGMDPSHRDVDELIAGGHAPVPRAVVRDEEAAAIRAGEEMPGREGEAER